MVKLSRFELLESVISVVVCIIFELSRKFDPAHPGLFLGGGNGWFSLQPVNREFSLFSETGFLRQAVAITQLTETWKLRNVKRSNSGIETDRK